MSEHLTGEQSSDRDLYIAQAPDVAQALLLSHVNASGSKITSLKHDEIAHPAQNPMAVYVEGYPIDRDALDQVAEKIDHRFPRMMETITNDNDTRRIINYTAELLEQGKNVYVITPHAGNITDIGFAPKIVGNLLEDQEGCEPRSRAIIISKALAEAGYDTGIEGVGEIGAVETLQTLCDRVIMVWPRTASASSGLSKLPSTEISRHNRQAVEALLEMFKLGGVLAAVAPTGTTRIHHDEVGKHAISPINKASIKLLMQDDTYVLPVATWLNSPEPVVSLCSDPVQIKRYEQGHELMELMAARLTERVEDMTFVYKTPRRLGNLATRGY